MSDIFWFKVVDILWVVSTTISIIYFVSIHIFRTLDNKYNHHMILWLFVAMIATTLSNGCYETDPKLAMQAFNEVMVLNFSF